MPHRARWAGLKKMTQLALQYEPKLTPDEAAVWSILSRRCGRGAAIPMPELAFKIFGDETATRRVQTIIHNLIEQHRLPIGSATGRPNGYFHIASLEEARASVAQNEHRIQKLSRRNAALRRHFPALAGQLSINEEGNVGTDPINRQGV